LNCGKLRVENAAANAAPHAANTLAESVKSPTRHYRAYNTSLLFIIHLTYINQSKTSHGSRDKIRAVTVSRQTLYRLGVNAFHAYITCDVGGDEVWIYLPVLINLRRPSAYC